MGGKYIGDNLANLLNPEAHLVARVVWTLSLTAALLPCVFIENIAPLKRISSVGLFAAQGFSALLVVMAGLHCDKFGDYLTQPHQPSITNLALAMGIAVFCNEGMVVLTPS